MSIRTLIQQTTFSNQAETSSQNPIASGIRMRTLIELQVISHLLNEMAGDPTDLRDLRASLATDLMSESSG